MSWADDNGISDYSFLDNIPALRASDKDKNWVTKDGVDIDYEDMETSHILAVIKKFNFTKKDMPNLFKELKKRQNYDITN